MHKWAGLLNSSRLLWLTAELIDILGIGAVSTSILLKNRVNFKLSCITLIICLFQSVALTILGTSIGFIFSRLVLLTFALVKSNPQAVSPGESDSRTVSHSVPTHSLEQPKPQLEQPKPQLEHSDVGVSVEVRHQAGE